MDTFKGQDNDEMKRLSTTNNCELAIVPHNLTNKLLKKQKDSIIKGFDAAGITEAIRFANDVFTRVESPFDEHRQQPL